MLIRKADTIRSSEITPQKTLYDRRAFMTGAAALGLGTLTTSVFAQQTLKTVNSKYTVADQQTPMVKATHYNNYYEFGTDKSDPARNSGTLHTRPWTVQVTGMVKKPLTLNVDDLIAYRPLESRVYRHRCVEAWSMVIPWDGYSLSEFINFVQPLPSAKYIQFLTLDDKKQMPDRPFGYDWPYSEGLRMDEAMNPLCLLTFGCYGDVLPNQNGAPIRIVTPWKYGFKNGKSIAHIHFTDKQPKTTWNETNSAEYGFYANVNPSVDHPRWSQAHERRIDASAFPHSVPTLPFNGYADQVASLYNGMDLRKYY